MHSAPRALFGALFGIGLFAGSISAQDLKRAIEDRLGLVHTQLVEVALQGDPGTPVQALLRVGGDGWLLDLALSEVRSPDFHLLAQDDDGSWVELPKGPTRTLRGSIAGDPGSRVAASLLDDGLYARIWRGSGDELWLQPVPPELGAPRSLYVAYRSDDVVADGSACGVDAMSPLGPPLERGDQPAATGDGAPQVAELACDADFQFFQRWGSAGATESRIVSVINAMNPQYENQVNITHRITAILIRRSANQPYTSTAPSTLLAQFRSQWLNRHGNIRRDVAQLFTGKDLNGSTIGIAYIGGVCNNRGYSVVQSSFNNAFACSTDLSAHELGHNWNAQHCSCTTTMSPSIRCANLFSPVTVNAISAFRNTRACLN